MLGGCSEIVNKLEDCTKKVITTVKDTVRKTAIKKAYGLKSIGGLSNSSNSNSIMSASSAIDKYENRKWLLWKTQSIIYNVWLEEKGYCD
jgi:hypothetical protein